VYGRGGEEGLALRAAGVPFRVIPGVSSAVAVPAYAGIPVTHRGLARRFTVVSGSTAELGAVPAEGWRAIASGDETLVVLMGWGNLEVVVERCVAHGVDPETPAAAIEQGTTAAQRTVSANLAELPGTVRAAGLSNPLVVVIGRVVELAAQLDWFDPAEARAAALVGEPTDAQAKPQAEGGRR
jgi:uroporphyrinogen III methyltransferase/synthase